MRYLFGLNFKSLLVLTGVSFFGLTLYSEELVTYLVEAKLISAEETDSNKLRQKAEKESKLKDILRWRIRVLKRECRRESKIIFRKRTSKS